MRCLFHLTFRSFAGVLAANADPATTPHEWHALRVSSLARCLRRIALIDERILEVLPPPGSLAGTRLLSTPPSLPPRSLILEAQLLPEKESPRATELGKHCWKRRRGRARRSGPLLQAKRVHVRSGIVGNIGVEVNPAVEADRVLRDEASDLGIVVSRSIVIESSGCSRNPEGYTAAKSRPHPAA